MAKHPSADSLRISPLMHVRVLSQKGSIMGLLAVLLVCGQWRPEDSDILIPLALDGHGRKIVVAKQGTILNSYERLQTDVISGEQVLLLSKNHYEAGDLLLVIENPWSQFDRPATFEFARVKTVDCERLTLVHGLMNPYSVGMSSQVIRVPEYHSLRIKADASITAPTWDGHTGGIIAIATDSLFMVQKGGELSVRGLGNAGDGGAIFVLSPEMTGKGRIDASGEFLLQIPYGIKETEKLGKGHPGRVMVWGERMTDLQVFAEGDGAGLIALPPRSLATCYGSGRGIYAQTTESRWAE